MDKADAGSCAKYHLDDAANYIKQIHFWKTPQQTCPNGKAECTSYTIWQQKWQEIKG